MNIIYKWTSITSGKSYIGKTNKALDKRFNQHIRNTKKEAKTHFHKAIAKYGKEDFIGEVLEENISDTDVNVREIYWISYYNTLNEGYNLTIGGDGTSGYIFSEEHKEKLRVAKIDYKPWNTGIKSNQKFSEEAKAKMAKAKKLDGEWHTPKGVFSTVKEAAIQNSCSLNVIYSRSKNSKYEKFYFEKFGEPT